MYHTKYARATKVARVHVSTRPIQAEIRGLGLLLVDTTVLVCPIILVDWWEIQEAVRKSSTILATGFRM